jgi:hypothetical protein
MLSIQRVMATEAIILYHHKTKETELICQYTNSACIKRPRPFTYSLFYIVMNFLNAVSLKHL